MNLLVYLLLLTGNVSELLSILEFERLAGPAGPLFRGRIEISLRAKAVQTLWVLLNRAGDAISKQELIEAVWPDRVVNEGSLSVCIREIRSALGDDPNAPRFVQTMHRYGYRFICPIVEFDHETHHSHFVGRHAELRQLQQQFEAVREGEHRLVLVSGHAGIGKSALIESWSAAVEARAEARVVIGKCLDQSGAGETYLPFIDALRRLASGVDAAHVLSTMRRVAPGWLMQFPAFIGDDERDALRAETIGVDAARMRRELSDLLFELSVDTPMILVIEDMHWCDASSAAALAFLASGKGRGRLLVVVSFRSTDVLEAGHVLSKIRGELRVKNLCTELELTTLTNTDVDRYLARRLEKLSSDELTRAIMDRTEGHPLFVEALVNRLASESDGLSLVAILDGSVPSNLETFIKLRLAEFEPGERRLLEAASVVGSVFSTAAIEAAIIDTDGEASIDQSCDRLCRRGDFLEDAQPCRWPDGTLTGRYAFRHSLFAEVIRTSIGKARWALLHQRVGERLELGYRDQTAEVAATLAHHFEQSHDIARAVNYIAEAANTASGRHAAIEAVALLRHGITLVEHISDENERIPLELKLLLALGPAQVVLEGYSAAAVERTFARARELCVSETLADHRLAVLRGLAGFHHLRADYSVAHGLGQELLSLDNTAVNSEDGHLLEGHFVCGLVDFFRGRQDSADISLKRAIGLYDQNQHSEHARIHGIDTGVISMGFLAVVRWLLGDASGAFSRAQATLELADSVDHPFTLCQGHAMVALLHQLRGDIEQTQKQSEMTSKLATKYGFHYLIACEQTRRGWILVHQGEPEKGVDELSAGVSLYQDTGAVGGVTMFMAWLAEAYNLSGDYEKGLEIIEDALALVRNNDERVFEAELLRLKGELLKSCGGADNITQAEASLESSLSVARLQRTRALELRTLLSLAGLWFEQGRKDEARRLLAPVRDQAIVFVPTQILSRLNQSMIRDLEITPYC